MTKSNQVVDILQTKKSDGSYEVVFVLQNGTQTESLILGQPVDKEKLLKQD
ncbi:hypothetical protein [Staphylococcus succinus]|uniref:hypothetical protein n=1 Tax=Staphylococcus succinus TaxID=61015 RepID=UPI0015F9B255|nr:hypothetical protein [Staphylococcus succinus]